MPIKYSVIIPAYNSEQTIARCLESVCNGRDDTEVIVINDGSKDMTEQICKYYLLKCPQLRYIAKENGGVSSARNLGLTVANGDYVLFVDSDDYVVDCFFDVLDKKLDEQCDFLMFGTVLHHGEEKKERLLYDAVVCGASETASLMCRAMTRQQLNSPVTKAFRRGIIENYSIRFDERLAIGEDKVFVLEYVTKANSARIIKDALYVISTENEASLSRAARNNLCDSVLLEHDLLFGIAEKSLCRDEYMKAVSYSYHRSAYTVIRELRKFDYSRNRRVQEIKRICSRFSEKRDCKYLNLKHRVMGIPINLRMVNLIDCLFLKKSNK